MTISRTTRNVHRFPGPPTEGLPGFACFMGEATHPGNTHPSVDRHDAALKNLDGEPSLPLVGLATLHSDGAIFLIVFLFKGMLEGVLGYSIGTQSWGTLICNLFIGAFYYWRLGKHIQDTRLEFCEQSDAREEKPPMIL